MAEWVAMNPSYPVIGIMFDRKKGRNSRKILKRSNIIYGQQFFRLRYFLSKIKRNALPKNLTTKTMDSVLQHAKADTGKRVEGFAPAQSAFFFIDGTIEE